MVERASEWRERRRHADADSVAATAAGAGAGAGAGSGAGAAAVGSTGIAHAIRAAFVSLFLPINFPESVTPDYLPFQVWDTIQAVSSYLRGLLCTQAILAGVGVGNAEASATSATVQWIVRDGAGMFGSMLFAWWGAASFGTNIKRWRLFADLINDVGLTLELLSPLFPHHFLLLACLGTLCRAMCGVAAGSTRAALMLHFARQRNVADLSAKEGIQETGVTLLGLMFGLFSTKWLDGSLAATWIVFTLLTIVHIVANLIAVRSLVLTSLDEQRCYLAVQPLATTTTTTKTTATSNAHVRTPEDVSARERLLWLHAPHITLGAQLPAHAHALAAADEYMSVAGNARSASAPPASTPPLTHAIGRRVDERGNLCISIYVHERATNDDLVRAYVEACVLHAIISGSGGDRVSDKDAMRRAYERVSLDWPNVRVSLAARGWRVDEFVVADAGTWRYEWSSA